MSGRRSRRRREISALALKWVDANLSDAEKKTFVAFVRDRISRGKAAISLEAADKLTAAKGKEFASPELLDKWLDENGIAGEDRKLFVAVTPTQVDKFRDELWCLNAADGKDGVDPQVGTTCRAAGSARRRRQ